MEKKVIESLAFSIGRNDEQPNIALAEAIVKKNDQKAIRELIELLTHTKAGIRSDAIKVIYEAGERKPSLIDIYWETFLKLLSHKDNRIRWGAMSALAAISSTKAILIAQHLVRIIDAMDAGTVITRDKGMSILANVARVKKHHADCMELMLEQIENAPVNQVNQYAEKMTAVISAPYKMKLASILLARHDVMAYPPKKKKLENLIKYLTGK